MTHSRTVSPLAERVLMRIEAERVRPRSRWLFALANYAFWLAGVAAVFFGALAWAGAIFEVAHAGWREGETSGRGALSFFFEVAPYLWALALLAFIALGYLTIRHTRRGYRYPIGLLALGAVAASLVLGCVLYALGFGRAVACMTLRAAPAERFAAAERIDICKGTRPYDGASGAR